MNKKIANIIALAALGLSSILLVSASRNHAMAAKQQTQTVPGAQITATIIDEEEEKAYRAAKREPDFDKRAEKLFAFYQKYPESKLMEQADFDNIKKLEDEYNTYFAARQESDPEKRAVMFIDFIRKNPKSNLIGNIDVEYVKMLQESSKGKRYEMLESLAEKWLKLHPGNMETEVYLAEATRNLQKYEQSAQALEEIYKTKPSPALAEEIYASYHKTGNTAKQSEWTEKLFKMPQFAEDYMIRYNLVMKYVKEQNLPKAAEYAQITLKSADLAKPNANTKEQLRKVRQACYHVIASNDMAKEKYSEAIASFKEAIKAERYGEGYYKIALCLDNQKQIEDAGVYYAVAELMGGEEAGKAKARLESLYKALHNDTLIGIDKVYKKAKDMLAEPVS